MTFRRGPNWSCDLRTSLSMNLILFPIAVGLLYEYVADNIDEEEREILDSCIMQFLVSLESSDYRSMREGANMVQANVVIAENLSRFTRQPAENRGQNAG